MLSDEWSWLDSTIKRVKACIYFNWKEFSAQLWITRKELSMKTRTHCTSQVWSSRGIDRHRDDKRHMLYHSKDQNPYRTPHSCSWFLCWFRLHCHYQAALLSSFCSLLPTSVRQSSWTFHLAFECHRSRQYYLWPDSQQSCFLGCWRSRQDVSWWWGG